MVSSVLYLLFLLAVILVWFIKFKRPVYEAVMVSFILIVAISNKWAAVPGYINTGLKTSLIYSMVVFMAMSVLLTETKIIDEAINIILALLGRVPGGAGYVSVISSAFMGALSGSGPGNVMATGTITIPTMIKSGFPPELAANVESNASYLGNMIPPSTNIVAALGAFLAVYPNSEVTTSQFWIICWGCSVWFIIQRMVMVYAFCRYYKVKPIDEANIPDLKESIVKGWKGLLLPVIILLPFILDYLFKDTFFTSRLGAAGAKHMSSSLLFFTAGIAAIYTIVVKQHFSIPKIADMFAMKIKSFSPTISTCIFGYMIGALFVDLNVAEGFQMAISHLNMGKVGLCITIPLISCFMSMVIPGSSLVVLFGSVFISLFASVGVSPLLVTAMLPCLCGVMCGITPPLALGMYAGMSIAKSDFSKTVKNGLWWVVFQYLLEVLILMELLPIIGL